MNSNCLRGAAALTEMLDTIGVEGAIDHDVTKILTDNESVLREFLAFVLKNNQRQNAKRIGRIVYTSESETKRSDVEETPTHFRVWFSENGKWSKAYRVSTDLERAKAFAEGWIAGTDAP